MTSGSDLGSKVWTCPNGCDIRTAPCTHLNRLISERNHSVNALPIANIEAVRIKKIVTNPNTKSATEYEYDFRAKLVEIGMTEVATDVLTMRFVYDMSLRDIAHDLSFLHAMDVYRILNDSIAYLKRAGYGR